MKRDNIKTKVLQNNSDGYKSDISIILDDKIVYQQLSIKSVGTEVDSDSSGMKELRRCYPANFSDYPEEIKKMQPKPWNINGNANPTPNRNMVTKFHTGNNVLATTYEIDIEVLSVEPLDGTKKSFVDSYADNVFGSNKIIGLLFFREIMKQVGEYVKNGNLILTEWIMPITRPFASNIGEPELPPMAGIEYIENNWSTSVGSLVKLPA